MINQAPRSASTTQNTPLVLHTRSTIGAAVPVPLSSFVGRERDVREISALIRRPEHRLITLVGPGGVGKTRLALEVAREVGAHFSDGIAVVDLSTIADPGLLEPSVARALGMREQTDRPLAERVADVLRDRHLLMVFDNFDPFVSASPLVARMLALCPQMTGLVTSREPLRVAGERVIAVPPLSLPDPDHRSDEPSESEAVRLFVERATAVQADFALSDANRSIIDDIVRRVDGLPLGIELAAARLAHVPPATLLERLVRRLPILTGGARDLPMRQRTLRGAIAWSYDLLTPEEQRVFRCQAVFAGGCTLEAAEAMEHEVSEDNVLDLLGSLVSRSLLRQDVDFDGRPRFTMLETVREFGLEQLAALGEEHAVRDRHAFYFVDLVERGDPSIWGGPDHTWWLDRLESELSNFEAALRWMEASGNGAAFLRMAAALGGLWHYRSHRTEGLAWLIRGLEIGGDTVPAARAMALIKLGMLERVSGGTNAVELSRQGLAIRKALGNQRGIGRGLMNFGNVLKDTAQYDQAIPVLEEAACLLEPVGDIGGLATSRMYLGMVLFEQGDSNRAHSILMDALALHAKDGFDYGAASTHLTLGLIEARRGNTIEAATHIESSLRLWVKVKNREGQVEALMGTASVAARTGQPELAARFLGAASAVAEALAYVPPAQNRERHDATVSAVREKLGDARFLAAREAGRDLPPGEAATEAAEFLAGVRDRSAEHEAARDDRSALTPREETVLRLLVEGHSDREIAQELGISYRSVTSYVRNILTKFNVHSRTAAATHAVRRGLV